jgi:hypothetical protein
MDTGGSFPGVKRPGHEADHSLPTTVETKNSGSYNEITVWYLVKHRDNLNFNLL